MPLSNEQAAALREATEQVAAAKAAYDEAKAARERLIHQVALDGGSYREIAAETDVSYQRVHQLLTGEKPPQMPWGMDVLYHCPRCGAEPGQKCRDERREGKDRDSYHAERHHRAYYVRLEGSEDPRDDEPGQHTAIYQAQEKMSGIGYRSQGPIYLDPDEAAAYVATLREGSYVARWAGRDWERLDA